eukprot:178207-Alexandrium_andersonii.AAC.1
MGACLWFCDGVGRRCLCGDAGVRGWVGATRRGSLCTLSDVSHERLCVGDLVLEGRSGLGLHLLDRWVGAWRSMRAL